MLTTSDADQNGGRSSSFQATLKVGLRGDTGVAFFAMNQIFLCFGLLLAFAPALAGQVVTHQFVRTTGSFRLDGQGTKFEIFMVKEGLFSYRHTRVQEVEKTTPINATGKVTETETVTSIITSKEGFFKDTSWFAYIESASRIWMFDGDSRLVLARTEAILGYPVERGLFAVVAKEEIPEAVWKAIPEESKKHFHSGPLFKVRRVAEEYQPGKYLPAAWLPSSRDKSQFEEIQLHRETILDETDIQTFSLRQDPVRGSPEIHFKLTPMGAKKFSELTAANIGRRLALIVNGEVLSAPTIQSQIDTGSGQITGNFSKEEAEALVAKLQASLKIKR